MGPKIKIKPIPHCLPLPPLQSFTFGAEVPRVTRIAPETEEMTVPFIINRRTTMQELILSEDFVKSLNTCPDVEIQIIRQRDGDEAPPYNWPKGFKLFVNENEVPIDRNKPIYIRRYIVAGINTMFTSIRRDDVIKGTIRYVKRVPVINVLRNIVLKMTFPAAQAARNIREILPEMYEKMCKDQPRLTAVPVTVTCPRGKVKINYPAKTRFCKHVQCFDLQSYLMQDLEPEDWKCPICHIPTSMENLIVDELFYCMILDVQGKYPNIEKFAMDMCAEWRPIETDKIVKTKTEDNEVIVSIPYLQHPLFKNLYFERISNTRRKSFDVDAGLLNILNFRPDLNIEFQCYFNKCTQDHKANPVTVKINNEKLMVDWENHTEGRVSYSVKKVLKKIGNKIEIFKNKNCGEHTFSLHLVHRPTAKSVLYDVLPVGLSIFHDAFPKMGNIVKVDRKIKGVIDFQLHSMNPRAVHYRGTIISAICPIGQKQIKCPARLVGCNHFEVFDLFCFLRQMSGISTLWKCPICGNAPTLQRFYVDDFLMKILYNVREKNLKCLYVFPNGSWRLLFQ